MSGEKSETGQVAISKIKIKWTTPQRNAKIKRSIPTYTSRRGRTYPEVGC